MPALFSLLAFFIASISIFCHGDLPEASPPPSKTVLLAITPDHSSFYTSTYLKFIKNLDYDKKLITIYLNVTNSNEENNAILLDWLNQNASLYHKVIVEGAYDPQAKIQLAKNKGLQKAKEEGTDYYFSLDSNVFLAPYTLTELISKDKPMIAPLLLPIPGLNSLAANFFADILPTGYFKEHPDFLSILHGTIKGTIQVPAIQLAYLIKTNEINHLNFGDGTEAADFVALCRNARNSGMEMFVCNERPFGVFTQFPNGDLLKERNKFAIIAPYINPLQEKEKKVVYIKTGYWGDIYDLKCPFYNKQPWLHLRMAAQAAGFDLKQVDSFDAIHHFEKLIIFDIFGKQVPHFGIIPKEKVIAVLWEPPSVLPHNYDAERHHFFSRIYTWRDDLVDNQKYFKIAYPDLRPMLEGVPSFKNKKLAILVSSKKKSPHANELYSAREKTVDFYCQNHPEDLDLFGPHWPPSPVYKGVIPGTLLDKVRKLKGYKFCYAYENIKDEPGYITEKILNCFQAGCVPIYWGASNVEQYIPKSCFISRKEFNSEAELYDYIKNMPEDEYNQYLNDIKQYLDSDQAKIFTIENLIATFMDMLNS